MTNFALIGAAGYIAPRHLQAVKDVGGQLIAAADPNDSVGILDRYFPNAKFFKEIERFDRYLEKLRRETPEERAQYISVCSPNYLHDAHVRLALRLKSHAICEKPLVISPWNIEALREIEEETDCQVYTVLQLRLLPSLINLRQKLQSQSNRKKAEVNLNYVTPRGPWYHVSWKGDEEKSGGITMNIGIHFFDLMIWLFGEPLKVEKYMEHPDKAAGCVELEWARLNWFMSVDHKDLPEASVKAGKPAFRTITVDGEELEFSTGFTELHSEVYKDILAGKGFSLLDAKPSIELVHKIRSTPITPNSRYS